MGCCSSQPVQTEHDQQTYQKQEIVEAALEKSKQAISHAEHEVDKQLEDLRQIELQLKSHESSEDPAVARQAEDKAVAIQRDVQATVDTAQLKVSQAVAHAEEQLGTPHQEGETHGSPQSQMDETASASTKQSRGDRSGKQPAGPSSLLTTNMDIPSEAEIAELDHNVEETIEPRFLMPSSAAAECPSPPGQSPGQGQPGSEGSQPDSRAAFVHLTPGQRAAAAMAAEVESVGVDGFVSDAHQQAAHASAAAVAAATPIAVRAQGAAGNAAHGAARPGPVPLAPSPAPAAAGAQHNAPPGVLRAGIPAQPSSAAAGSRAGNPVRGSGPSRLVAAAASAVGQAGRGSFSRGGQPTAAGQQAGAREAVQGSARWGPGRRQQLHELDAGGDAAGPTGDRQARPGAAGARHLAGAGGPAAAAAATATAGSAGPPHGPSGPSGAQAAGLEVSGAEVSSAHRAQQQAIPVPLGEGPGSPAGADAADHRGAGSDHPSDGQRGPPAQTDHGAGPADALSAWAASRAATGTGAAAPQQALPAASTGAQPGGTGGAAPESTAGAQPSGATTALSAAGATDRGYARHGDSGAAPSAEAAGGDGTGAAEAEVSSTAATGPASRGRPVGGLPAAQLSPGQVPAQHATSDDHGVRHAQPVGNRDNRVAAPVAHLRSSLGETTSPGARPQGDAVAGRNRIARPSLDALRSGLSPVAQKVQEADATLASKASELDKVRANILSRRKSQALATSEPGPHT